MRKASANALPFLFFALILSLQAPLSRASPAPSAVPRDVESHWARPYVAEMIERGIVTGYEDGTFRPDRAVSREEFCAVLSRTLGFSPVSDGTASAFSDVGGSWAAGHIAALEKKGVLRAADYSGVFRPSLPITRQEIVTMLVRAAGLEGETVRSGSLTSFTDPIPERAKGYVAAALNHGLVSGYPDGAFRPSGTATRAEAGLMVLRLVNPKARPAVWRETYTYDVPSGKNTLQVVRVNLKRDDVEVRPALAGCIGQTAELDAIAKASGAVAAVNGGYFSAYPEKRPLDPLEPYNAIKIGGTWVHFTYSGTTMGITAEKEVLMAPIRMKIEGSVDGKPGMWGAWSLNHTAPDAISVFNTYRGGTTRMPSGRCVVVRNGRVAGFGGPDVEIPSDGYVIYFPETCVGGWSWKNLKPGSRVSFDVVFTTHKDEPYPDSFRWRGVVHAIGCGPRLVAGGKRAADPRAEGITEDKQTVLPYNRSAVGVTSDGILIIATCNRMTIEELADALVDLGAKDAMQLDSGASSGLFYEGKYLTRPGRKLASALVVVKK